MRFPLNNKIWFKQILFLSSFTIISFLMKFLSEWTHEYLGHCCIGSLAGGFVNSYFVSWIWPLEFGYAFVSFFGSVEPLPRILMYSGGIITCLTAAFMSQGIIAILGRKGKIGLNWLLIPLNFLFWYGFWAFMNSVGYLLIGGLINFGDIYYISSISGISHILFLIPGFITFFLLYYLISKNFFNMFKDLTNINAKWMLFLFWLLIPTVFIFFMLNPAIAMNNVLIIIAFPLMLIPSTLSFFFSKYLIKDIRAKE